MDTHKVNIKTVFKPVRTLENIFRKPKDQPTEKKTKGILYKVKCKLGLSCKLEKASGLGIPVVRSINLAHKWEIFQQ